MSTLDPSPEFWAELRASYQKPPRFYHSYDHVSDVLRHYRLVEEEVGWQQPCEVYAAILFHDVVYEVGRKDNEKRSAELARAMVAKHLSGEDLDVERVASLIELTARHGHLRRADVNEEEALFLDCDMAILGAPTEDFAAFEAGVRAEYLQKLEPDQYRAGRKAFLERLHGAEHIFLSPYFHARLDAAARRNIRAELART